MKEKTASSAWEVASSHPHVRALLFEAMILFLVEKSENLFLCFGVLAAKLFRRKMQKNNCRRINDILLKTGKNNFFNRGWDNCSGYPGDK